MGVFVPVPRKTKGKERFPGHRHKFQRGSDELYGKIGGKLRLTMGRRCGDTSDMAVEIPILRKGGIRSCTSPTTDEESGEDLRRTCFIDGKVVKWIRLLTPSNKFY